MTLVWLAYAVASRLPWPHSYPSATNCSKVRLGCVTSTASWNLLAPPPPRASRWPNNCAPTWMICWPYRTSCHVWMPSAITWIRSAPAIGPVCSIATISKDCRALTTTSKVTSVTPSGACSALLARRDKPAALRNAPALGNSCPDRLPRLDVWLHCAKYRLTSWRKNSNAYVSIRNASACTRDPFDESMPGLINSVNSGSLSQLRPQGDFCGIAFEGWKPCGSRWRCGTVLV
jgi:hypothetical protein